VISDQILFRPNEIKRSGGSAAKAMKQLRWHPQKKMQDVIFEMLQDSSSH